MDFLLQKITNANELRCLVISNVVSGKHLNVNGAKRGRSEGELSSARDVTANCTLQALHRCLSFREQGSPTRDWPFKLPGGGSK